MLSNVPMELREFSQFVLWKLEDRGGKKPTKVPYSRFGYLASVTDPSTWCSYEEALSVFESSEEYAGIGYVLTKDDPFAVIDLDDAYDETKGYTPEQSKEIEDRQVKVMDMFDSFSEISPSGKGLHILCRGEVPQGRKRAQIEVYSSARFITVTGNVYQNKPLADRSELLLELWSEMGKDVKVYSDFGDQPAHKSDEEICDIAYSAQNGTKFYDLYTGNWQLYYSSQSEADFALIDIVAFYTQNRAQITRIFRMSALGQRDKAFRDDYVEYMINRSFDHMLPPVDIDGLRIQLEAAILANNAARKEAEQENGRSDTQTVQTAGSDTQNNFSDLPAVKFEPSAYTNPVTGRRYEMPPGLLGQIADFIYNAAKRPVPEIALAGAIGLMSGICGRSYNVSGTGLNQYTLLIAPTGTGKEAMSLGIDRLMAAVNHFAPNSNLFIGPGEISSPQALAKQFHRHSKSFVGITGEIGLWLQQVCSPNSPPHFAGIKRMLLDLYNKSGNGAVYKPIINSDKEKSTDATKAPSFSLLGESTPQEFYKILDDSMISSGLLPRFSIVEYMGIRPRLNKNADACRPSESLVRGLSAICINALALNETDAVINVGYTEEAQRLFDDFNEFCDDAINAANANGGGAKAELWNRTHLKSLKLAAMLAVGVQPYHPCIELSHAQWATRFCYEDTMALIARFDAGDVGTDNSESKQINELIKCIRIYVTSPCSDFEKYSVPMNLHSEKIVTYAYLQRRLSGAGCYKSDRQGATSAIKRALQTLTDRGDIREIPRSELAAKYNTTQRAFMISNIRTFEI